MVCRKVLDRICAWLWVMVKKEDTSEQLYPLFTREILLSGVVEGLKSIFVKC